MSSELISSAPSAAEPPVPARDRILQTAGRLFYREGYRAIGVDRVIAEAEVAKATFYKHFPSKDDLIVAWLNKAASGGSGSFPAPDGPRAMSDYVTAMMAMARRPACLGCTFQASAAEFGASDHPIHVTARAVKTGNLADLEQRARAEALSDPVQAATEVFLIIEGLWAAIRMFGPDAPFDAAEAALRRITARAHAPVA